MAVKVGQGNKKYILIPEQHALHALGRIYGPKTGPLDKPTPVPIPVIGELLEQKGKEAVTILEVVPEKVDKMGHVLTWSTAIKLTKSNYMKSYNDILGIPEQKTASTKVETPATPAAVVDPTHIQVPEAMKAEKGPGDKVDVVVEGGVVIQDDATITLKTGSQATNVFESTNSSVSMNTRSDTETGSVETVQNQVTEVISGSDDDIDSSNDPWPNMTDDERRQYAKMSKAERKAARRAHRTEQ